ncbi:MAG: hypothetical protein [Microvirus sp.]|nr:MAG: hypothetical protein [Microvirus sp.]
MKRHKLSMRKSRSSFTHYAKKTHKKNLSNRNPMRGGIRL